VPSKQKLQVVVVISLGGLMKCVVPVTTVLHLYHTAIVASSLVYASHQAINLVSSLA